MSDQEDTKLYDQVCHDEVELETTKGKAVATFTLTNPTWVVKFERMAMLEDELILRHGSRMCKVDIDVFEEDALHKVANFKELYVHDREVMKNASTETEKQPYQYRAVCAMCGWRGEWQLNSKDTAARDASQDAYDHEEQAEDGHHYVELESYTR